VAKKASTEGAPDTTARLNQIAEELGRFLGTATGKAENLYERRDELVKTLTGIRDSASKLIDRVGEGISEGRTAAKTAASKAKGAKKK
jgi:hypothetical protein